MLSNAVILFPLVKFQINLKKYKKKVLCDRRNGQKRLMKLYLHLQNMIWDLRENFLSMSSVSDSNFVTSTASSLIAYKQRMTMKSDLIEIAGVEVKR